MVYHRFTPFGEDPTDTISGFGMDTNHYLKVREARREWNDKNPDQKLPLDTDFGGTYDKRTGWYIDGRQIETRHHPLHDYHFIERATGKRYNIDMVCYRHHFGEYIEIFAEHNKSHADATWENISCHCPSIHESIERSHKRFELVKNE